MSVSTAPGAPRKARPRGIPTTYRGARFRSRLEARWAAFFDLVGWSWVYEPFDTDGWIPDFLIQGAAPFLVEVGPCITPREYVDKAADGATGYCDHPTLVVGASPLINVMDWQRTSLEDHAGLFINEIDHEPFSDGPAQWMRDDTGRVLIYGDDGRAYPNGIGWSDAGGLRQMTAHELVQLHDLWRDAGNQVQWRRR